MFPLVAIGAAILGTVLIKSSSSESTKESERKSEGSAAVSPQSYIVTPLSTATARRAESISVVDAIGKFIV